MDNNRPDRAADDCESIDRRLVETEAGINPAASAADDSSAAEVIAEAAVDGGITRRRVVLSMLWSATEIYAGQLIQFTIGIFLARLLLPSEYGAVAIIGMFITLGQVFIDSGLSQALVRKKDPTPVDYSTVYYTNLAVSAACYLLLFILAPLISGFYRDPQLLWALRAMCLTLIIGAFSGVMRTRLVKELAFKKLALISLATSLVAGVVAIFLAYQGWGIWALVVQTLLATLLSSIWIIAISPFHPRLHFSRQSFNQLFGFGSKLLGSNIIWAIFSNIYILTIGRFLTPAALGYYSRADGYSRLIPSNAETLAGKVLFPVISKIQDDEPRLNRLYTRSQSIAAFYVVGANTILAGLAYPIILIMISAKWLPCVPLLQILCIGAVFDPVAQINAQFLIAKGHSGAFLKMQSISVPLKAGLLAATLWFGLTWIAVGRTVVSVACWLVSTFYFHKLLDISTDDFYRVAVRMTGVALVSAAIGIIAFNGFLAPTLINTLAALAATLAVYIGGGALLYRHVVFDALNLKSLFSR